MLITLCSILQIKVGDPVADHQCWMRPENMKTPRMLYKISKNMPGTEIAAMAASSIVFRRIDTQYSHRLINKAKLVRTFADHRLNSCMFQFIRLCSFFCLTSGPCFEQLFEFARQYKGTYDGECPFYCSFSGYNVTSSLLCYIFLFIYMIKYLQLMIPLNYIG